MERLFFMPAPRTSTSRTSSSRVHGNAPGHGNAPVHGKAPRRRPAKRKPSAARTPKPSAASALEAALDATLSAVTPADVTFSDLGLPKSLVIALAKRGFAKPFAIQARAIPDVLAGRDVLGRAQTGGGKTLAFGLPLLARLGASNSKRTPKAPRALVLVPTRELATQVADELRPLGETLGLKLACVFGGAPYGKQIDALARGVDLVVATPGRLIDLLDKGACTLRAVEIAVLDEADHMADLGFMPAVVTLLDQTDPDGQRLLFSATLDRGVDKLVRAYLHEPALHAVAPAVAPISARAHRVFLLRHEDKVAVVTEVAARPARTLIFVRTKYGAERLAKQLCRAGVDAGAIHGNHKPKAPQRAVDGVAAGRPRVLVATDVAARGIHVDDVDLVVHFDPPSDSKDYLHRSGRTARAGASGTALTLVTYDEQRAVAALHREAGVSPVAVEVEPGHAAVRELATSGEPITVAAARDVVPTKAAGRRGGAGKPRAPRKPGEPRAAQERFAAKAKARSRKPRHRQARLEDRRTA
jgi:superfamily II DNA/RNA helicase